MMAKSATAKKNLVTMPTKDPDPSLGIPKSLVIAERGIETGGQYAAVYAALIPDLLAGRVTPSVGNAVCNAGAKLLKIVEMQQRWGTQRTEGGARDLALTVGSNKAG
jgi:hypothetical protein